MSTSNDRALVDTNVLVYAADTSSSFHEPSRQLRDRAFRGEIPLVVTPQVLMEFFAVITSPRRVTTPRSPEEARAEVEKYARADNILKMYPDSTALCIPIVRHSNRPSISCNTTRRYPAKRSLISSSWPR
jgi:predicted nucleic acid-binding protein